MVQQGQVFKLKARCSDGEPLWAYRYRVAGRSSARLQVGGFSTKAEAQRALQNKLARLLPGGRSATLTLGEWVEEYLDTHQGERVTVAKLRWLLGKATAELGEVRLAELSPEQVCAWRLTVPEGHRFEATQAAAVRFLGADPGARRAARAFLRADGRVRGRDRASTLGAVRARTVRRGSCRRCRPDPTGVCERTGQADEDAAEQTRRSAAGDRTRGARPATAARRQPAALPEHARRPPRLPQPNRRHWKPVQKTVGIEPLRDLYDLRHTCATFALRAGVPVFALSRFMGTSIAMIDLHYGHLAVDSYQHAVSLLDALALERAVDAGWTSARRSARPHSDTVSRPHRRRLSAGGGRSVDVKARSRRYQG
jgi:hypothetical protein